MLKFIIRLDDACPNMYEKNWIKIEKLLDKYNIKPIVGIIPNNHDKSFNYKTINDFWTKYALKWQNKGWIIAQHGYNHNLTKNIRTEFARKSYETQKMLLIDGYNILKKHHIYPTCFFAPAHTFDKNTIKACKTLGYFKFISDGCAFYPYLYKKMLFIPSVFDTPHKISNFGIFTFIFHPNNINDSILEDLEKFITMHKDNFKINLDDIIHKYGQRKRNILDLLLQFLINSYRLFRKLLRKDTKDE